MLALPVIAVAADTLLAHFTPDGNWGSLAYTQADMLPVAQIASVFGVGGVLFVVMLFNSALALAIHRGLNARGAAAAYGAAVGVVIVGGARLVWRLQTPVEGKEVPIGIASINDFIKGPGTEKSREVWRQYDAQVTALRPAARSSSCCPRR